MRTRKNFEIDELFWSLILGFTSQVINILHHISIRNKRKKREKKSEMREEKESLFYLLNYFQKKCTESYIKEEDITTEQRYNS